MTGKALSRSAVFAAAVEAAKPDLSAGDRLLLVEACRLVDRLDRFDDLLAGKLDAWLEIDWPFEDSPARLVISSLVGEARQHVSELRQVVKALNLPAGVAAVPKKSPMDELLAKREAKRA